MGKYRPLWLNIVVAQQKANGALEEIMMHVMQLRATRVDQIKNLAKRSMIALALSAFALLGESANIHAQSSTRATPRQASAQMQRSLELNEQGVLAIKARQFENAEQLFAQALEIDSRNITAVFNLAGMYITNKKESQAVYLLSRYAKNFPKDAGLQARLGDAHFGSQNLRSAVAAYEAAYRLDPTYPGLPAKLGTLYSMQNKLPKAATMYEQAVKANPGDAQSLKNLSSVYLGLGKPQLSIITAKKALQISSTSDVYVTLGNAYQELRDEMNALNAFLRAQEMGHKDPNLAKVIEGLTEKSKKGTT